MTEAPQNTGMPRGALVVVAIGLLACVLAAVLSNSNSTAGAAVLEWEAEQALPDSRPATVPGGGGKMRIVDAGIRAAEPNESGYRLYRTTAVLSIDRGAPVGNARIKCAIHAPRQTSVAQTPGSRASYPRSSENLKEQEVPENVLVEFSANGSGLALLRFSDAFKRFSTEPGIKLEWPSYRIDEERWEWFLPSGRPAKQLDLGFGSVWRTTVKPSTKIACTLTTSAGTADVETAGALSG